MSAPDCREIIAVYLVRHGYSGLCSEECGCELGDLFCCCGDFSRCVPGYRHVCVEGCPHFRPLHWHECPCDGGPSVSCVTTTKDWPAARDDS